MNERPRVHLFSGTLKGGGEKLARPSGGSASHPLVGSLARTNADVARVLAGLFQTAGEAPFALAAAAEAAAAVSTCAYLVIHQRAFSS